MMGKSAFFSEGTAGQMKSAPSFAKDDDSTLPKEPNGSKIGLRPKPIWGMSVKQSWCKAAGTGNSPAASVYPALLPALEPDRAVMGRHAQACHA
jgi:hypothetical protein